MSTVTVVIPTFNHSRYLMASILSVLEQRTNIPIEIVVVDDCSEDDTHVIKEEVSSLHNLVWVHHDENKGKLAALNTASSHIRSDYVVVLDSDDLLEPEYIEECYRNLLHNKVDFVYTGCSLIDYDNHVIGYGESMAFCSEKIEKYSFIPDLAFTTARGYSLALPLDESVRVLPKHYRWKKLCRLGLKGYYIRKHLFRYRMHDLNMSGIGLQILENMERGRRDHHLLSGYWKANQIAGF